MFKVLVCAVLASGAGAFHAPVAGSALRWADLIVPVPLPRFTITSDQASQPLLALEDLKCVRGRRGLLPVGGAGGREPRATSI